MSKYSTTYRRRWGTYLVENGEIVCECQCLEQVKMTVTTLVLNIYQQITQTYWLFSLHPLCLPSLCVSGTVEPLSVLATLKTLHHKPMYMKERREGDRRSKNTNLTDKVHPNNLYWPDHKLDQPSLQMASIQQMGGPVFVFLILFGDGQMSLIPQAVRICKVK